DCVLFCASCTNTVSFVELSPLSARPIKKRKSISKGAEVDEISSKETESEEPENLPSKYHSLYCNYIVKFPIYNTLF
ncbi:MAG: hypothetical protein ACRD8Z_21125, partial [Nitrososphaeraceae archaeon]